MIFNRVQTASMLEAVTYQRVSLTNINLLFDIF